MGEIKSTGWVQEKPEDVFPELEKSWVMDVRTGYENVTRYTTYTSPTGKVKLIRGEVNKRGKWRTFQWLVYEFFQGKMECTIDVKTRRDGARWAMRFEKKFAEQEVAA